MNSVLARAEGLWKWYGRGEGRIAALKGVSLEVRRGELLAVVGPSGSGKSVLLMILGGVEIPDEGEVIVDGVRVSSLPGGRRAAWRRRNVGFVFQFFHLMPTLTALENVLLGMELAGRPKERSERIRRAKELLEFVGLKGKEDRFPGELSGGEQQRVALARALGPEPLLVLADEPTANLDTANKERVVSLLKAATERGATVVYATHDPSLAKIADRVVRIRDGEVVDGGGG
ncbi:MAG: ABC transporter ATP-binding protein [Aeropyrum sp.]|nr:ABC transporter ATP-binding protein [Aeropyrum sp.]MCE4616228.1 ABC transporter ATP-binding protein [Aeropyrum sp.]